ncbi:MAG TPA: CHAT domain-containing protein, partial [Verrucomicrobiae bacterium]|nr:CHAT domain-containing protein [Verrucomicrobiae bacterium]
ALLAIHYGNLALNYFEQHKTNEMLQYADKAEQAHLKVLENILSFASEQQRLTYTAQNDPYVFFAAVNDGPRMAQTVLRHKAVVLDSLLEDRLVARASENPKDQNLIKQLAVAKQQMTELSMTPQKGLTADVLKKRAETNDALSGQIEQMEGTLAQKVTGFGHARRALTCTVDQVQKMIPPQTVLLEFVHYTSYLDQQQRQPHYGAVLLTSKGEPKWINLGAAGEIETNILHYQRDIRGIDRTDDAGFSQLLGQLYKQTLEPLVAQLPADTKTIVISPDGWLNFVSFATLLVSSNQFLAEKYTIRYVTSGRDLLQAHVEPASQDAVFFAAPDYAAGGLITIPRTGLQLQPLPFLAKNTYDIIAEIKSWNWPVKIYSRAEATESNLYNVHSPRILQFSTHGFLLPENINVPKPAGLKNLLSGPKTPSSAVVLKNPMYRNGIALAGAQVTLDAWKLGEVRPTDNDGMLMADEAGNLDLRGTWLVVLAACDTGMGDPRFGEGVMGLRRGFAQAGAQNLMMTLWPVFDVPSGELLLDFYSSLHQNNNPAKALAETQRDSLIKFRTKYGLLPAVVLAGGFILSSQGPLDAQ